MAKDIRWTAIPAKRSRASDATFKAALVIGILAFAALMGPLALLLTLGSHDSAPVDTYAPPVGGGVARMAAAEFMRGKVAPLPVITPDEVTVGPNVGAYDDLRVWPYKVTETLYPLEDGNSVPVEIHTFLYIDNDGGVSTIDVPVSIQAGGEAVIAGTPTLSPYFGPETGAALIIDAPEATIGDAAADKIQRWAVAYFGDARPELRDIAGDPEFDYRGIGGYQVEGPVGVLGYYQPDPARKRYIARVQVVASNGTVTTTEVFDIVVDETGPVPVIPGWGPMGSAWLLF